MKELFSNGLVTGPSINRGNSRQDWATPWEFIHAVEARFGKLTVDLAASDENKKAPLFFDEEADSFKQKWSSYPGNLWLNPEFDPIAPWAEKCAMEANGKAKVFMLTPASVGSNWFAEHVHPNAFVLFLSPRMKFVGAKDAYPKDLILSCFLHGLVGSDTWRWK